MALIGPRANLFIPQQKLSEENLTGRKVRWEHTDQRKHWRDKTTETHEIIGVGYFTQNLKSKRMRVVMVADAKVTGR